MAVGRVAERQRGREAEWQSHGDNMMEARAVKAAFIPFSFAWKGIRLFWCSYTQQSSFAWKGYCLIHSAIVCGFMLQFVPQLGVTLMK